MKYVQTVCGPISPEEMGFTLPHEHIFWNLNNYLPEDLDPNDTSDPRNQKICIENLCELKYNLQHYPDNVVQQDLDVAAKELNWYKEAGGSTICDCTVHNLKGNPIKAKQVSQRTGVHVVLAAGLYCPCTLPEKLNAMDKYEAAALILKELREGVDGTDIKAGFIKVGVDYSVPALDERNLAAAAIAQKETVAAILIHQPGLEHRADDIFKALTDNGGDLSRVVMCHCDPLLPDHDYIDHMAKSGAYISFDFFGLEVLLGKTLWLPTDKDRIFAILEQIDRGNLHKILVSHDTVYKSMLRQFGGFGYAHLPKDIIPLLPYHGYKPEWIDQITIHNPREVFSLEA